jgi:steroid delta-isomerase-like uncharacterized protein
MSETESANAAEGTRTPAETTSEATPSIEWIRDDFTPRWFDAWNSHEVDRVLALMSEDIEYRDDGWPKPMRGHADVREFLEAIWRATPDMTFELLSGPYVIPGEPRAAFHWRGWGTHTGPLEPPGLAPTGRRYELDGVDFYEYRDGRVCQLRVAFDMLSVSRQLGLMPAAGSRAERALAMAQRSASRMQQAIRERRGGAGHALTQPRPGTRDRDSPDARGEPGALL